MIGGQSLNQVVDERGGVSLGEANAGFVAVPITDGDLGQAVGSVTLAGSNLGCHLNLHSLVVPCLCNKDTPGGYVCQWSRPRFIWKLYWPGYPTGAGYARSGAIVEFDYPLRTDVLIV